MAERVFEIGAAKIRGGLLQRCEDFGASLVAAGQPASHVAMSLIIVGALQLRRLLKPGAPREAVNDYVAACVEVAENEYVQVPSSECVEVKCGSIS